MGSSSSRDDRTVEVDEDNCESEESDVSETETSDGGEQEMQEEEQGKDERLVSTKRTRCSTATFSSSEDEEDGDNIDEDEDDDVMEDEEGEEEDDGDELGNYEEDDGDNYDDVNEDEEGDDLSEISSCLQPVSSPCSQFSSVAGDDEREEDDEDEMKSQMEKGEQDSQCENQVTDDEVEMEENDHDDNDDDEKQEVVSDDELEVEEEDDDGRQNDEDVEDDNSTTSDTGTEEYVHPTQMQLLPSLKGQMIKIPNFDTPSDENDVLTIGREDFSLSLASSDDLKFISHKHAELKLKDGDLRITSHVKCCYLNSRPLPKGEETFVYANDKIGFLGKNETYILTLVDKEVSRIDTDDTMMGTCSIRKEGGMKRPIPSDEISFTDKSESTISASKAPKHDDHY